MLCRAGVRQYTKTMRALRSAAVVGGYCRSDGAEGHSGGTHFVSRSVHQGYPMVMVVYHAMDNSELNEREQSRSSSRFFDDGRIRLYSRFERHILACSKVYAKFQSWWSWQ